jgi:hypothetical protein
MHKNEALSPEETDVFLLAAKDLDCRTFNADEHDVSMLFVHDSVESEEQRVAVEAALRFAQLRKGFTEVHLYTWPHNPDGPFYVVATNRPKAGHLKLLVPFSRSLFGALDDVLVTHASSNLQPWSAFRQIAENGIALNVATAVSVVIGATAMFGIGDPIFWTLGTLILYTAGALYIFKTADARRQYNNRYQRLSQTIVQMAGTPKYRPSRPMLVYDNAA